MKSTSVHCYELINNLLYNRSCIKNAKDVDFAGIIKTKKDQTRGHQAFKCTVAEAKQIKKYLGSAYLQKL